MISSKGLLEMREDLQNQKRDLFAEDTLNGQWCLPPEDSVYLQTNKGSA